MTMNNMIIIDNNKIFSEGVMIDIKKRLHLGKAMTTNKRFILNKEL